MKVLDLFSGIGGFSVGLEATGMQTVAFCETDKYCKKVLKKNWPEVPIYDDVRELTAGRLLADGIEVDVITGGFPCQDISLAGKQEGIAAGTRSGLWTECARLLGELRPQYAIFENVTNLLNGQRGDWFKRVLWDISALGYDAEWHCIPASELGAHHHRDRIWIIAYPSCEHRRRDQKLATHTPERSQGGTDSSRICEDVSNSDRERLQRCSKARDDESKRTQPKHQLLTRRHRVSWREWETEPNVGRVVNGLPSRAHRIRGLGNAIVPQIATMIGNAIWDNSGL